MSANDRELLELAAKASRLYTSDPRGEDALWCADNRDEDGNEAEPRWGMLTIGGVWNPLTDDGDALRLAVKLALRIEPMASWCVAFTGSVCAEMFSERVVDGDRAAATRRAIVRAAAAKAT